MMDRRFWKLVDERIERHLGFVRHLARRTLVTSVSAAFVLQGRGFGAAGDEEDDDERFDDVELFQHVGFSSRPKQDDEVVVLGIGGSSHPISVASHGGTRPSLEAGDAALHNHAADAFVKALDDGTVDVQVGATKTVKVRTGDAATTEKVAMKSDVESHSHAPGTYVAPPYGGPVTGISAAGNTGTYVTKGAKVLQAEKGP